MDRLHAKILAPLIDDGTPFFFGCNVYDEGFKFECRLQSCTNHTFEGYEVIVVVLSINSDLWTDSLFDYFNELNLNPTKK